MTLSLPAKKNEWTTRGQASTARQGPRGALQHVAPVKCSDSKPDSVLVMVVSGSEINIQNQNSFVVLLQVLETHLPVRYTQKTRIRSRNLTSLSRVVD